MLFEMHVSSPVRSAGVGFATVRHRVNEVVLAGGARCQGRSASYSDTLDKEAMRLVVAQVLSRRVAGQFAVKTMLPPAFYLEPDCWQDGARDDHAQSHRITMWPIELGH